MNKIHYVGRCLLIENKKKRILVIGDLHLGYQESLRESGVFVPGDLYGIFIGEVDEIFNGVEKEQGKIDEVVLLGDLKHEFGRIMRSEWKEVGDFLDYLASKCKKIAIIKGNHDPITGIVSGKKGVEVVDYYIFDEFAFVHGDRKLEGSKIYDSGIKYWIMGHGHPAVRISDGVKEEKYKCFLVGKYKSRKIIILPSFISFNEGTDPRDFDLGMAWEFDFDNFDVKIINEEGLNVLDFGKLKRIN